jgi:hypothetical protein
MEHHTCQKSSNRMNRMRVSTKAINPETKTPRRYPCSGIRRMVGVRAMRPDPSALFGESAEHAVPFSTQTFDNGRHQASIEPPQPPIMICRSCLRAASRPRVPSASQIRPQRFLSTTSPLQNATPISATTATQSAGRQGDSSSSHTPPTATSTSAAQPFSEPLTPAASPALKAQAAEAAKKKVTPLVKSSIAAGTPLKGLNFLKDRGDPVALADDEYPSWLWTILDRQEKKAEAGQGDIFCTSHTHVSGYLSRTKIPCFLCFYTFTTMKQI